MWWQKDALEGLTLHYGMPTQGASWEDIARHVRRERARRLGMDGDAKAWEVQCGLWARRFGRRTTSWEQLCQALAGADAFAPADP